MRKEGRVRRHYKIRKHLKGTKGRPRICVFRSSKHIYVQMIDDAKGETLIAASDLKIGDKLPKVQKAFEIGKRLAKEALKKGIKEVVFDRGGFLYHGRVKSLAEGVREGGLKF